MRWLDQRFAPTIASIPPDLVGKLQAAEIYHQILEHRWFLSERNGRDVPTEEAVASYCNDILRPAPDEQQGLEHTGQLQLADIDDAGAPHRRGRVAPIGRPRPSLTGGERARNGALRYPRRP